MLAVALTGRVSTAAAAFGVSRTRASVTVEGPGGAERASTMRCMRMERSWVEASKITTGPLGGHKFLGHRSVGLM